jgi:hypothetical protein
MEPAPRNSRLTLWELLRRLFTPGYKQRPVVPADNLYEPVRITTSRVLLVVYDPVMEPTSGIKLSAQMNWNRPGELVNGFVQDILEVSHGTARFQITERIELDEFPLQVNGSRYTPEQYLEVFNNINGPHTPPTADYATILAHLEVNARLAKRDIDEVWLFGFPYAGFYESTMAGPQAFWCNAPPVKSANFTRRFVVMGFSFERGIGEMLENFGHRAESILDKVFSQTGDQANLYTRYTRYDQKYPGQAEVGNVHFAPNSEADYDWNNPRLVTSSCDDWYNFPAFKGIQRLVNAAEWGNGDIRKHHLWWLNHLPHVAGRTSSVHNNWWQYIMDPNLVLV